MKSWLQMAAVFSLACALALMGCLDSVLDADDVAAPGGKTIKDSVVVKDSVTDTTKPPIDTINPPVDTLKPPADTIKAPVDTVKPPVDTIKTPVDTLKPPVDTVKVPVDSSKKYAWGFRKYPCESAACPELPTWPGDTLYISVRRNGATVYRELPITTALRFKDFVDTLASFLRDSAVAAGPGTRVDIPFGAYLTIDGNSAAIVDLRIHNNRFGLMSKPLDIPAGTKPSPAKIGFWMSGPAMMDCKAIACPDSLTRLGDTLFYSAVKDGVVEGGFVVMKDQAAFQSGFASELTRFLRSLPVNAGLGTQVDNVTPMDSYTLKGSFTIYGNSGAITGIRIRNSRLGNIVGPLDIRAGTTRLSVVYWLPSVYGQPWPIN